jgi:hypothetical protein
MIVAATLLALATLATPSTITAPGAGYSPDTMRHLKGHPSLPARAAVKTQSSAAAVCHPDPGKGRVCRHHVGKQDEARKAERTRAALAANEAERTDR